MASISKAETGYRDSDFKIAVALGAGMTNEEAAEFAECSRSTVFDRKAGANRAFIEFVTNTVKAAVAASVAQSVAKATERIKQRYDEMYDQAVENLNEFLTDDDSRLRFSATTRVLDEMRGKPVQRIETKSDSTQTVRHEVVALPSEELQFLIGAIRGTRTVLTGEPPLDAIEGEIVTDTARLPAATPGAGSFGAPDGDSSVGEDEPSI